MIWICKTARMKLLQIRCEVLYPLSVKELESVEFVQNGHTYSQPFE